MDPAIIVAGIALVGTIIGGLFTLRATRAQAREAAASAERIAEQQREADAAATREQHRIEAERLRREEINQLRHSLEGIIARLNEELQSTRKEMKDVRDQLEREEGISDQLRARIRELEEMLHRTNIRVVELEQQLARFLSVEEASP